MNLENVEAWDGSGRRLKPGGYVIRITRADDVPLDPRTGRGDYLRIYFDVAEGPLAGIYSGMREERPGWTLDSFTRSYKERALGMFKHFCNVVNAANPGLGFGEGGIFDERALEGKALGAVFREEEYERRDGGVGTRAALAYVCLPEKIRSGGYDVPDMKKLDRDRGAGRGGGWAEAGRELEADLPFN